MFRLNNVKKTSQYDQDVMASNPFINTNNQMKRIVQGQCGGSSGNMPCTLSAYMGTPDVEEAGNGWEQYSTTNYEVYIFYTNGEIATPAVGDNAIVNYILVGAGNNGADGSTTGGGLGGSGGAFVCGSFLGTTNSEYNQYYGNYAYYPSTISVTVGTAPGTATTGSTTITSSINGTTYYTATASGGSNSYPTILFYRTVLPIYGRSKFKHTSLFK